jgi:1,4-dihydroxy-2-naphthoate octaprenyltransferase
MYLAATSGPLLLWIGLFGVLVVITYTAGPLPLAYLGLGEIAVFLAFGPLMVLGAYYAVSGRESWLPVLASLPLACTVSAILHANNMRDLEADRAASKRTLAVRFGREAAKMEFAILVYGAYGSTAGLVLLGWMPWPALLAFITLPEAIDLVRLASSSDDPKVLHRAQGLTARLHFRLGLALTVGWLVSALAPSFTR